jgi:hypothetical protein
MEMQLIDPDYTSQYGGKFSVQVMHWLFHEQAVKQVFFTHVQVFQAKLFILTSSVPELYYVTSAIIYFKAFFLASFWYKFACLFVTPLRRIL